MMRKRDLRKTLYEWLQGACQSILPILSIVVGCLCTILWNGEAYAAETIQVIELCVVHDGEGIRASCSYQNLGSAGSILQLYLEKMNEDGEFIPLNYVDLPAAGEEIQTADTLPVAAEPGTYRAVLLQYYGEGIPVVRFRDSGVYEVKSSENPDDGSYSDDEADSIKAAETDYNDQAGCEHSLAESIIRQATPVQDAILEECCEKCGLVFGRIEIPNSAYEAFLNEAAEMVKAAQSGEEAVITTDRWMSFDKKVLDVIESRRDISVLLIYRYQGAEHQIWIPAESDVSSLADENGFCGFAYLSQRFGEKFDE